MADLITGNTQLSVTKAEIISAVVQKELAFAAKLMPYVTDVSQFAVKGANNISFPKLSSFTITNRTSGAQGDSSVLTATKDTISLNFNAYCAWIVDSMDEVQTSIDAQMEFARRAAAAHGRYVDTQILAVAEADAGLDVGVAPITRDLILDMREQILKSFGDLAQTVLVIGPDQEKEMLKISEFTQAQIYGGAVIPNGVIGSVYGCPVVMHQGVAAGKAYMWEKSAIALGFQKAPAMSSQGANEFGTSAMRVAMDQLFGVDSLQQGMLGAAAGTSPLITKI